MADATHEITIYYNRLRVLAALAEERSTIFKVIRANVDGAMREALIRDICDELGVDYSAPTEG